MGCEIMGTLWYCWCSTNWYNCLRKYVFSDNVDQEPSDYNCRYRKIYLPGYVSYYKQKIVYSHIHK